MSRLEELRTEAAALEASGRQSERPIQHCAALDQVAKRHGYKNWRAARAVLSAEADPPANGPRLRRYESERWGFGVDIPLRWNAFPAVPANSPYEVIRFASSEQGNHGLIVFREPHDPDLSPDRHLDRLQDALAKGGFGNFAVGEAAMAASKVRTLDFDKAMDDHLWSCRHYIVPGDTLRYVLGFGTTRWASTLPLIQRLAASFTFEARPWGDAE